jgi:hypothetical protein
MGKELVPSNDEYQNVVSLVEKKKKKLPVVLSERAAFLRVYSMLEYQNLRDMVTSYGEYVDEKGVKATSLGGFVIQINKKLKECFGVGVGELRSEEDIEMLAVIRKRIALKIARDMENKIDRADTKKSVYKMIDDLYELLFAAYKVAGK